MRCVVYLIEWVVLHGALVCLSNCLVLGGKRRFEKMGLGVTESLGSV